MHLPISAIASGGPAVVGPVIESTRYRTGGSSSLVLLDIYAPVDKEAGDLLVALVTIDTTANSPTIYCQDVNWNQRFAYGTTDTDAQVSVWTKTATAGTDTLRIELLTGPAYHAQAWMLRVSGADLTTPINAVRLTNGASISASHVVGGITPDRDNCLPLYLLAGDSGVWPTIPHGISGAGWTLGDTKASSNTNNNQVHGSWGYKDIQPIAEATGSVTVTPLITDGAAWAQFAINAE